MRFQIGELPFVVTDVSREGEILLTCAVMGHSLRMMPSALFEGMRNGEIRPWGRPYLARERLPFFDYERLDEEQMADLARKTRYVMALHRLGKVSYKRGNGIFQKVIEATALALGDPNPPAPTSAYDLLRDFRNCGCDPKVFARRLNLKRPRGMADKELQAVIDGAILELHQRGQAAPTNAEILKLVNQRYRQLQRAAQKVRSKSVAPEQSGPSNRVGKLFVDYLRNGHGATTAAAFSARARAGQAAKSRA